MDLEKLSEFLIPIGALVLYLILNARGKKKEPERARPEPPRERTPPRQPAPHKLAPLQNSPKVAYARPLPTPLEKKARPPSYASKLIKGKSLRRAFLMKEILNRPYE
jgi:hypothetical protein